MSKLKKLSQDDLSTISDDFGEILEREVSKNISTKEVEDLDLDITINYENDQFRLITICYEPLLISYSHILYKCYSILEKLKYT